MIYLESFTVELEGERESERFRDKNGLKEKIEKKDMRFLHFPNLISLCVLNDYLN